MGYFIGTTGRQTTTYTSTNTTTRTSLMTSVSTQTLTSVSTSTKVLTSTVTTTLPWGVIESNLTLTGPVVAIPCRVFNQGTCPPPSTAIIRDVELIAYGPNRYYLISQNQIVGYNGSVSNTTALRVNYTMWFTNSTIYCISPAFLVGNAAVIYPTCPTTPYQRLTFLVPSSYASSLNSTMSLRLELRVQVNSNNSLTVTADEFNMLDRNNTVYPEDNWRIPQGLSQYAPCLVNYDPVGFAIYHGNYDISNFSTGTPLEIWVTPLIECPYFAGTPYYIFQPSGSVALEHQAYSITNVTISFSRDVSGFWSGGNPYTLGNPCPPNQTNSECPPLTFNQFPTGNYTIVGDDQWRGIVFLRFNVS